MCEGHLRVSDNCSKRTFIHLAVLIIALKAPLVKSYDQLRRVIGNRRQQKNKSRIN